MTNIQLLLLACSGTVLACSTSDSATSAGGTTSDAGGTTSEAGDNAVPAVFSASYGTGVTLSATSTTVTLRSKGVPDHKTPYWGTGNALYEDQLSGHTLTPGVIREQTFAMTIPINPAPATTEEATALGPIGMALNGVAIYNDREGGNVPVDETTANTMDLNGAHVGPGGTYHYHFEPVAIAKDTAEGLIGHLRDGYPVYGRHDKDGSAPTDLDSNGGHSAATNEYPAGIYHYHCSSTAYLSSGYYIIKSGSYHGTKGTFTQ